MKVETDIASITASLIERAVKLVIIYVETFKTDIFLYLCIIIPSPTKLRRDIVTLPSVLPSDIGTIIFTAIEIW
jgi:hypothetical protein